MKFFYLFESFLIYSNIVFIFYKLYNKKLKYNILSIYNPKKYNKNIAHFLRITYVICYNKF
jgi:hypothetical protein